MADNRPRNELRAYQSSIPVRLIATGRSAFVTCLKEERLADVLARTSAEAFDFVPVVDESDSVVGVLPAHTLRELEQKAGTVSENMEPLGERFLIGADTSILEFIEEADSRPFRFVVNGNRISGLVSISDLQQLPVRAALFAMVTQLEMVMANSIRNGFAGEEWLALLSEGRKDKLNQKIAVATRDENKVETLLYTEFADKVRVLCKGGIVIKADQMKARTEFHHIQRLRDNLAHANQFAASRVAAVNVCEVVRTIDRWILRLGDV